MTKESSSAPKVRTLQRPILDWDYDKERVYHKMITLTVPAAHAPSMIAEGWRVVRSD